MARTARKVLKFPVLDIASSIRMLRETWQADIKRARQRVAMSYFGCGFAQLDAGQRAEVDSHIGFDSSLDIRLRLEPDGHYSVRSGAVDYDADMAHAVTSVPFAGRFDSVASARGLINEAADFLVDDSSFPDIAYALTRKSARGR